MATRAVTSSRERPPAGESDTPLQPPGTLPSPAPASKQWSHRRCRSLRKGRAPTALNGVLISPMCRRCAQPRTIRRREPSTARQAVLEGHRGRSLCSVRGRRAHGRFGDEGVVPIDPRSALGGRSAALAEDDSRRTPDLSLTSTRGSVSSQVPAGLVIGRAPPAGRARACRGWQVVAYRACHSPESGSAQTRSDSGSVCSPE
jgi:hypothetical protein